MKRHYIVLTTVLVLITSFSALAQSTDKVLKNIDKDAETYANMALQIWDWAEVGYQEEKSSALLQQKLTAEGFAVTSAIAGIPTAFLATYGSGSPVIGILAEYDALPGISQAAVPEKQVIEGATAGHACGHHLFGAGSVAAAVAIKDWLKKSKTKGTIRLYGTPAEEGGAGKVYLVREGLFDDVDVVLHWHPSSTNSADATSSLANKSAKFRFYGVASHAAGAPERGRSALDGVEAMNMMVNMMREHVPMESRIHYVITHGGEAPNVVPAFAEVYYYVRNPEMQIVRELFERVVKAAEGAALGTGTTMDYEIIHGIYNLLPNETLARLMHKNLLSVGGVEYTEEEVVFAESLMTSYESKATIADAQKVSDFKVVEKGKGGSTDVGDVSWTVPTAGLRAATWVPGTTAHSWQAVAAGGTNIGVKGMLVATKTITLTAIDIFKDPAIITTAKQELYRRRGDDFVYNSLLGDRKPPLDYRK